jgi:hypothetical protein
VLKNLLDSLNRLLKEFAGRRSLTVAVPLLFGAAATET